MPVAPIRRHARKGPLLSPRKHEVKTKHFPAVALLALAVAQTAQAEVTFNGFGQVVAGATLDDGSTVTGLSYDDSISFDPESLFALQATATLGDRADAVAQV